MGKSFQESKAMAFRRWEKGMFVCFGKIIIKLKCHINEAAFPSICEFWSCSELYYLHHESSLQYEFATNAELTKKEILQLLENRQFWGFIVKTSRWRFFSRERRKQALWATSTLLIFLKKEESIKSGQRIP